MIPSIDYFYKLGNHTLDTYSRSVLLELEEMNIADQITFKEINGEIAVVAPRELAPIAETLEDIGDWIEIWQPALDALSGKGRVPYWAVGDGCAVQIEKDGMWFGVQPEFRGDRIKIPNQDAKLIIERFLQVSKDVNAKDREV